MVVRVVLVSGGLCSWEGMKRGGDGYFFGILLYFIVFIILGVLEFEDFIGFLIGVF